MSGPVDVVFAIYTDQSNLTPLWQETQTLQLDEQGRYTALLGAMSPEGLPINLFTSGAARWLGVSAGRLPEEPRILLVSVPYALKAGDAETLGGKPASAFMLSSPGTAGTQTTAVVNPAAVAGMAVGAGAAIRGKPTPNAVTPGGTANYIAGWVNSTTLGTSAIYQDPTTNFIGVGTGAAARNILEVAGSASLSTHSQAFMHNLYYSGGWKHITDGYGGFFKLGSDGKLYLSNTPTSGTGGGSASPQDRIVIDTSGKVGIGTGSPTAALDVRGTGSLQQYLVNSSGNTNIALQGSGGSLYWLTAQSAGNGTRLLIGGNGATEPSVGAINVLNTGSVGIGTTSPAAKLEVNGTAKFNDAVTFAAGQTFPGTATNAINLNGVAGTSYARLDTGNSFAGNQTVTGMVGIGTTPSRSVDVVSTSTTLAAVKAIGYAASSVADNVSESKVGVWGDSGSKNGMVATSDSSNAITGLNNTSSQYPTAYFQNYNGNGRALSAGGPSLGCTIWGNGTITCGGGKAAEVGLSDGRKVLLYAVESPQLWFEDFGSAALSDGIAAVALDPVFADTVNLEMEYRVFLTPRGDCEGLYVSNQSKDGFEVRELRGGKSAIPFDYRIVAHRKGYESVRLTDVTNNSYEKMRGASKADASEE